MSDRPEYVIHAKVKNNLLLSRILERSTTVAAFCAEHGLPVGPVGELVNLKAPALLHRERGWRELPLRLSDILGVLPEELFSAEQQRLQLATNEVLIEVNHAQALCLVAPVEAFERREALARILAQARLTGRERQILQLRFVDENLQQDCAATLGVTQARIWQIEQSALEKLRAAADKEGLAALDFDLGPSGRYYPLQSNPDF